LEHQITHSVFLVFLYNFVCLFSYLQVFRPLEFRCQCMCFLFPFVFLRKIRTIFIILHDSFQNRIPYDIHSFIFFIFVHW
jgi:hypothetical protein